MLAVILATATMTWGLVAWAHSHFTIDSLWPIQGAAQLHPVHLIGLGLATLPVALSALLLPEADASNPASKKEP